MWRNGKSLTLGARKAWFVALVRSYLTYASNAFYPGMLHSHLNKLIRLSKSGIRAVFRVPSRVPSGPLFRRLQLPQLETVYREKVATFVFRCMNSLTSPLFNDSFQLMSNVASGTDRVTRGQESRLLCIPFLPGPAGRSTMRFVGSVVWNELPPPIRLLTDKAEFLNHLKATRG